MSVGRFALGAVVVGAAASVAVAAGPVDKVQVGVSGRNATRGLSRALFVDVPVVADYTQLKFDGEQGDWRGPDYTATKKPGTGATDLSFRSEFENDAGSVDGMVHKALVQKTWTESPPTQVRVPRILAGRNVGSIGGEAALFEEPITGAARYESLLALPLCRGVFGAIDFYADAPPQDTSGSAGQYLVGTTPAKQWNHDHALAATQGVALDGPLPGGHVSAHRTGKGVAGAVGDCGGGLSGIPLTLQRRSGGWKIAAHGTSGAGGAFTLAAHGRGSYRVVAALGPFKATSAVVAVR